jgi:hypothetical protein
MPVEYQDPTEGNVVCVKATGKLTAADYEAFVPALERCIEARGPVRLLFEMHDFHGWELGAMWDDLKFGAHHAHDIERIAMIGETKWQKHLATFSKPFTLAKVRYFNATERDEAKAWINE